MANCPKCSGEQNCPCNNCKERSGGKVVWKWIDGELIECGHCSFTLHADAWLDLDHEEWKRNNT